MPVFIGNIGAITRYILQQFTEPVIYPMKQFARYLSLLRVNPSKFCGFNITHLEFFNPQDVNNFVNTSDKKYSIIIDRKIQYSHYRSKILLNNDHETYAELLSCQSNQEVELEQYRIKLEEKLTDQDKIQELLELRRKSITHRDKVSKFYQSKEISEKLKQLQLDHNSLQNHPNPIELHEKYPDACLDLEQFVSLITNSANNIFFELSIASYFNRKNNTIQVNEGWASKRDCSMDRTLLNLDAKFIYADANNPRQSLLHRPEIKTDLMI